jgi:hypothetical protein
VSVIVPEEDEADWLPVAAAVFVLAEQPGRAGPAAGVLPTERQVGPGQPGR